MYGFIKVLIGSLKIMGKMMITKYGQWMVKSKSIYIEQIENNFIQMRSHLFS